MTDLERIRAALEFVPADDRETWLRMGMAVKAELNGEGFDVWDTWSQSAESYNAKDTRDVWRSIRPDGKVSVGTLYHEAKARGWRDNGGHPRPTPAAVAERQRATAERAAAEQADIASERADTAAKAAAVWTAATLARADHPYLERKRIAPVPTLREITADAAAAILNYQPKSRGEPLTGRLLVVPAKRGDGLSTLELIDETGRKTALAGRGTKAGAYWATWRIQEGCGMVLIGEGVATAATCRKREGDIQAFVALRQKDPPLSRAF